MMLPATCPSGLPHVFDEGICGFCNAKEVECVTPIKNIYLFGVMVLVEDWAENIELKATCPNERDAEWLARSLAGFHKVEVDNLKDRPYLTTLNAVLAK